jgi:hypothetical protein
VICKDRSCINQIKVEILLCYDGEDNSHGMRYCVKDNIDVMRKYERQLIFRLKISFFSINIIIPYVPSNFEVNL